MLIDLISDLRGETDADIISASEDAAVFLQGLLNLEKQLRRLHDVATYSLVNDPTLDECARGHRQGTIEVVEAVLRLF